MPADTAYLSIYNAIWLLFRLDVMNLAIILFCTLVFQSAFVPSRRITTCQQSRKPEPLVAMRGDSVKVQEQTLNYYLHADNLYNMKVEKYQLKSESSLTSFEFMSEGPKGLIRKRIEFQKTTDQRLFNLAFGDKNPVTGEIDDEVVSNNGDSEKVLATVVGAVYSFFDQHPDTFVYAKGSTKSRTRLYRIGITKYIEEMKKDFYLYGQIGEDFFPFQVNIEYDGFLAQRKFK